MSRSEKVGMRARTCAVRVAWMVWGLLSLPLAAHAQADESARLPVQTGVAAARAGAMAASTDGSPKAAPAAVRTGSDTASGEVLLTPRAMALGQQYRCLVCRNQSIAESDATLARDLMHLIADMDRRGASDEEIRRFLVSRYGAVVTYAPAARPLTLGLWLVPLAGLVMVGGWLWRRLRRAGVGG